MLEDAIKVDRYLGVDEIDEHLKNVEYIIMAAPTTRGNARYPIHFTIFLNTTDNIPRDVQVQILNKFCKENEITNVIDELQELGDVAFANVSRETIMPQYFYKPEDAKDIPTTKMHIIDFEANARGFKEPKDGKSGWSYSYC